MRRSCSIAACVASSMSRSGRYAGKVEARRTSKNSIMSKSVERLDTLPPQSFESVVTRASHGVCSPRECSMTRVSHESTQNSFPQECPTRLSNNVGPLGRLLSSACLLPPSSWVPSVSFPRLSSSFFLQPPAASDSGWFGSFFSHCIRFRDILGFSADSWCPIRTPSCITDL